MKLIWKVLSLLFTVLLIVTVHIFVVNFLPFPFNHINIMFSWLLLLLTTKENKKNIWLAMIVPYLLELFNSVPFGIGVAAAIISLLTVNWFQLNILTNRSGTMVFLSLLLGIAFYRFLFILFLSVNNYFSHQQTLPYREIIADAGWEISISSVVMFLAYFIGSSLFRRLNKRYTKYAGSF